MCQLTSSLSKPSYENVKLRLKFDLFKYRVRIIYNFIFQIFSVCYNHSLNNRNVARIMYTFRFKQTAETDDFINYVINRKPWLGMQVTFLSLSGDKLN